MIVSGYTVPANVLILAEEWLQRQVKGFAHAELATFLKDSDPLLRDDYRAHRAADRLCQKGCKRGTLRTGRVWLPIGASR